MVEALLGTIVVIIMIGIAAGINYSKGEFGGRPAQKAKEREEARKAELNKPISQMTPAEKAKHLRITEQLYSQGKLTFAEYDALKSAYTDKKSFSQTYGMDFTIAVSDKLGADKALEQHKKDTQKQIITNSAIGSAVGGIAGGIAASVSTASKASIETERLLSEQEQANKRYEEALKRSIM